MITHVVYFTRSGTSQRVAQQLAQQLNLPLVTVTDNHNWKGFIGFIKGGFYSSNNKAVKITTSEPLTNHDELIVVSPLWAGGVAPAIRQLLTKIPSNQVHLVVTSNGSTIKQREGYRSVSDIVRNQNHQDQVISQLVNKVTKAES